MESFPLLFNSELLLPVLSQLHSLSCFDFTAPGDASSPVHSFITFAKWHYLNTIAFPCIPLNLQLVLNYLDLTMFSNIVSALLVPALLFSSLVQGAAQVDKASVGPLTPLSAKSKICNVLDYGAKADNKTDIGPAILSAFSKCAITGGATIYVPPGSYSSMSFCHLVSTAS